MQGSYVFTVDPATCRYVHGKYGPMLRFSVTHGFIEAGMNGRQFLVKQDGCIGTVNADTKEFDWSPPLNRLGPQWRQLSTPTKEIKDGVIAALKSLGVVEPFIERWERDSIVEGAARRKEAEQAVYTLDSVGTMVTE